MIRRRIVIPMLHAYPDFPNGSSRVAWREALYFAKAGHEVWVVTQDVRGGRPERRREDGFEVLRYHAPPLSAFDPRRWAIHQRRTADLLRRYLPGPADAVLGHSLLHYEGALSVVGGSTRTAYTVHSPAGPEMLAACRGEPLLARARLRLAAVATRRIERRCLERTQVIRTLSEYTRRLLVEEHGIDPARIRVIPGSVDGDRFHPVEDRTALKTELKWPTTLPVFFTLRRLVTRMGLDRLLVACARLRKAGREFHLVIGGEGPLQVRLEQKVRELGLTEVVRFVGRVSEAGLPEMYAAADAFVLPTAELECFGLIALEAMASGRPVLATPVGAIPEVIGRYEPGWLARDASAEAIKDLLSDFLAGRLPRHEPALLSARVRQDFDPAALMARVLDEMVGTPGGPM